MTALFAPARLLSAEIPLAVPVDGQPFKAELAAIDEGWLTFSIAAEKRQLAFSDLVVWGACPEPKHAPVLILADGGLLAADSVTADKETLRADSEIFGQMRFPLSALAGVVFRLPATLKDRDVLFDRIAKAAGESDRLLLENGDELSGLLETIAPDAIKLNTDVGTVNVELDRAAAIIFNPSLRGKTPEEHERCWLGTSDGSRLLAGSVRLNSSSLKFVAWGRTWSCGPNKLVFLQPLFSRVTYLSELKPSDYHFEPFLDLTWPYCPDRGVTGTWLRADGNLYLKGIGVHSFARLTYDLDQPYKQFQAELAIDDSARGGGSVQFKVVVDGQEKFAGKTIRGGMKPEPITVDLRGAKQLELIVDYADRADVLDHADWLNARLIK